MSKKALFAIFLIIQSTVVFSTADVPARNWITKELYTYEDVSLYIGIGWQIIPESKWNTINTLIKVHGYRYTNFPYKIELILLLIVVISVVAFFSAQIFSKNDNKNF